MTEPKYLAYYFIQEQVRNPYYNENPSKEPAFITEDRQKAIFLCNDNELAEFILENGSKYDIQYFTVAKIHPSVKTSISLSF